MLKKILVINILFILFLNIDSLFIDKTSNISGERWKKGEGIEKNLILKGLEEKVDELTEDYSEEFISFYKGVILGEREGIKGKVVQEFNYLGATHLLVVSGLHIGIVIALSLFILSFLPYQIRYILTGVLLTLYCYGIGFTPSVLRAYIMGGSYLMAKIFYEEKSLEKGYILSFIISTTYNPYIVQKISFQMSYLALFAIIYLYPKLKIVCLERLKKENRLIDLTLVSFSIQLVLTPLFLYNFRVLPIFTFLVNLILIPLGTFIIQGLFLTLLLSYIHIGGYILPAFYYSYLFFLKIIETLGTLPYITIYFFHRINVYTYISLYVIIIILLKYSWKRTILTLSSILLFFTFIVQWMEIKPLDIKKDFLLRNKKKVYYRVKPERVLIVDWQVDPRSFYEIIDENIGKVDSLVTTKEENINLFKNYNKNINLFLLKDGEGIDIERERFIDRKGRIKREVIKGVGKYN